MSRVSDSIAIVVKSRIDLKLLLLLMVLETCEQRETGNTRITGLNSSYIGYLEICRDSLWVPVSYDEEKEWTSKSATVACRELGFIGSLHIMNYEG